MQQNRDPAERPLALALQGGGSFGAFTWGVLDRLLAEPGPPLAALSGASAGAVNAVLLADGLLAGGREEAQARLARFWRLLSDRAGFAGLPVFGSILAAADLHVPHFAMSLPGSDPLRELLGDLVDFARLRKERPVPLLVAATRVRDGEARIFREDEITLEAVLASACLPLLREAVRIEGEDYWDGGYSANPPVRELIRVSGADDLLLVQLAPDERATTPRLRQDIRHRSLELAFAAPLRRELQAIEDMRTLCREATLFRPRACRPFDRLRLHRLSLWEEVQDAGSANPANLSWPFLTRLSEAGRTAAERWRAPASGEPPAAAAR
ncbi:patatin-like phospholipase family protein [Roseomonas sp. JC162]|uniref:Patatin-like phospholipase family protein n=1 Tax=Neoroseomonas marina TaxID=1232220 RepID=A0A848EAS0_9PROT|nr:patatin-like phospholipase family protein [Neoroseomonas marina]NMJ40345.1 patatin-like phospholipase family protein [Neoroseomonas marina]